MRRHNSTVGCRLGEPNAFGADAVWAFKPTREGNTVVLAQRTPSRPTRTELAQAAQAIQTLWGLPATKWLRVFKPVQP